MHHLDHEMHHKSAETRTVCSFTPCDAFSRIVHETRSVKFFEKFSEKVLTSCNSRGIILQKGEVLPENTMRSKAEALAPKKRRSIMALTRNALKDMGIAAEHIDKIIEMHMDSLHAVKDDRDKYRLEAEKLPEVQRQLEKAQKELESKATDDWEQKYKDAQKALDDFKADTKAKEAKASKSAEYKRLIKEAGIPDKYADAIVKISGDKIDALKIGKDGKAEDADKLIEAIKKEHDTFVVKTEEKGADTPKPPANGDPKGIKSRDEIVKMTDGAARRAEIRKRLEAGLDF